MNLRKIVAGITSAVLAVSLLGCASIVDGGHKTVSIKSQPADAKVTVYDKKGAQVIVSQTPAKLPLKRSGGYFSGAKYRIVVEKEGYKPTELEVKSTLNGWYFGNLVFGGLIGLLIVDPATGAMWTLSPRQVDKVLDLQTASVLQKEGGLVVMLRQDIPEQLDGSLEPLRLQ